MDVHSRGGRPVRMCSVRHPFHLMINSEGRISRLSSSIQLKRALCVLASVGFLSGCASKSILSGPLQDAPPVRSVAFRQTMGNVVGTPFSNGNLITTLV